MVEATFQIFICQRYILGTVGLLLEFSEPVGCLIALSGPVCKTVTLKCKKECDSHLKSPGGDLGSRVSHMLLLVALALPP